MGWSCDLGVVSLNRTPLSLIGREIVMSMKLVMAIVKPSKLDQILEGLARLGIKALTVTEVKGYGRQKGPTEIYRGMEYTAKFLPMLKVEAAVPSHLVGKITEAIVGVAKTGQTGDGKIFVFALDDAVSIRTGASEEAAPPFAA
jgi:nitrogen regulatory protein P-II 2